MILTLTTDFGLSDGYVGAVRGAIVAHASGDIRLLDNTHQIPPQDVLAGACAVLQIARTFPDDTVHLCIVDPGVGSTRAGLVVRAWEQWFVAPDSGILHFILDLPDARVWRLHEPEATATEATTFAGRDWFARAAARLATGSPVDAIADAYTIDECARLNIPQPVFHEHRWVGQVLHTDRYGNIISTLPPPPAEARDTARVFVGEYLFGPIRAAYSEVGHNKPVATIGSLDTVEAALNGAAAARRFGVRRGQTFEILFPEPVAPPQWPPWQRLTGKSRPA